MPKLVHAVACEKVIVAQDNTVSLITLFEGIDVTLVGDYVEAVPEYAPIRWQLAALWLTAPTERGETFEQLIQIEVPNGKKIKTATLEFTPQGETHRTIMSVVGFPTGFPGQNKITLLIRKLNISPSRWSRVASLPVQISHKIASDKAGESS
jgi:hypothetical protein